MTAGQPAHASAHALQAATRLGVVEVRRAIEHRADNILAVLAGGRSGDAINQLP